MKPELKPVQLTVTLNVSPNDLMATPNILEVVTWAKLHKQQMDNAKKLYDEAVKIIKDYMLAAETLISPDGARLATYIQAPDKLQLDTAALKREFNDVYVACCNVMPGNRTFLLK